MSFSYYPERWSTLDQTRFLIGDTDLTAPTFQDEEISGNLAIYGDPMDAAIAMATAQAAVYARKPSMTVDGLTVNYRELSANFTALAQQLRKQRAERPGMMGAIVSGVSISDVHSVDQDRDRVKPQFRIGMDDDPPPEHWHLP